MENTMIRCPLCTNMTHSLLKSHFLRCNLCSIIFTLDNTSNLNNIEYYRSNGVDLVFPNWNNWLFRSTGRFLKSNLHKNTIYFSPNSVRMFVSKHQLHLIAMKTNLPFTRIFSGSWMHGRTIQAKTERIDFSKSRANQRLTLGVITTIDAWPETVELCQDMASHICEAIVVLDTDDSNLAKYKEAQLQAALDDGINLTRARVLARELDNNFAAQRNHIQNAANTGWVIQLDSDERLTPSAKRLLSTIIDDADRNGWSAIALPRRNLVDGVLSALYPDIQYRLLKKNIHFTRSVHEYPDLAGKSSFVFLSAEILHNIDGSRLSRREAIYEGIQLGAGRPRDTTLLRTTLEVDVKLPEIDDGHFCLSNSMKAH